MLYYCICAWSSPTVMSRDLLSLSKRCCFFLISSKSLDWRVLILALCLIEQFLLQKINVCNLKKQNNQKLYHVKLCNTCWCRRCLFVLKTFKYLKKQCFASFIPTKLQGFIYAENIPNFLPLSVILLQFCRIYIQLHRKIVAGFPITFTLNFCTAKHLENISWKQDLTGYKQCRSIIVKRTNCGSYLHAMYG